MGGDIERTDHMLYLQSGADVRGGLTLGRDDANTHHPVFRTTVFPLEATQFILKDRHLGGCGDCGDLFLRLSLELNLGTGDFGQVARGRVGLGSIWGGADFHVGRNFDGRTIWGVEGSALDETRWAIPGIVIGYDRMTASSGEPSESQLTVGLRWALPWFATDWKN